MKLTFIYIGICLNSRVNRAQNLGACQGRTPMLPTRRLLSSDSFRVTSTPFFVATLLMLTAPAFADGVQFVPLQDYINQADGFEKDPAALGYVMNRCSALYLAFAKSLEGETAPDCLKAKDELVSAAEKFLGVAVSLEMRGTTFTLKDALDRTQRFNIEAGDLYIDRMNAARLRAGNSFADALIAGDFNICKGLLAGMQ